MSLKTWKAEYYPVEADEVPEGRPAIEHSLRKWIGLRKENIDRHAINSAGGRLFEGDEEDCYGYFELEIDDDSCALCQRYINKGDFACEQCPLFKFLGYSRCDDGIKPFVEFIRLGDPEPMIAALQGTLEAWDRDHPPDSANKPELHASL